MTKVQKKINWLLTVVMVLSMLLCLGVCVQVVQGKNASVFGFRIYRILTGSMEPTIPTGTNVIVHEVDPLTLEEGDIITFVSRDLAIYGSSNTHRIVAVETDEEGKTCFRTKGDANRDEDALLVYPEDVEGKVVFHLSGGFATFLGYLHTKVGFVTVILLPILVASGMFMRDFRRQVKEYVRENAEQSLASEAAQAEETKEENNGKTEQP